MSPVIRWQANPGPQLAFLATTAREVLYGGAAAGGKSEALIAGQLRYADHPMHRGLILRRTRPQLQEVIDRTKELYPQIVPGADWVERENRWRLPRGGFIQMGYAEHEDDILNFKSFEYNLISFDELTSFTERMYRFMFSRNRTKSRDLPPLMRAASNPGDIGHEWVFNRFIRNRKPFAIYEDITDVAPGIRVSITRQFIPAKVFDNPKLPNRDEYIAGLLEMGEEGAMYLHGVWVNVGGVMFKREIPEVVAKPLRTDYYVVRAMDYGLVDPVSVHWLAVYPDNTIDIVGELYINESSVDAIAEQTLNYEDNELRLRKPIITVGDPKMFAREGTSMQSIASMLDEKGVHYEKANNDRVTGWAQIQRYIYRNQLRIWRARAPNLVRTLPNLLRHPTKPNDIKDRQEDHAADSLRYGVLAVYEQKGTAPTGSAEANPMNQDQEFAKLQTAIRDQQNRGPYIDELGYF